MRELVAVRNLEVVEIFSDAQSAKEPNRKGFNEMVRRIENGEADGIVVWDLKRLARNPIDNGTIKWLLQQGKIKKIITPFKDYKTEDNVLMIGVEFDLATQEIIDLAKNVTRGMEKKIREGWFPGKAKVGYINDSGSVKGERKIYADPVYFKRIKYLWDRLICEEITNINEFYKEMIAKCPIHTKKGKVISRSTFYSIFRDIFYTGNFIWKGELYEGNHPEMISISDYQEVQKKISRNLWTRQKKLDFAYKGLIKCGNCGFSVSGTEKADVLRTTGEEKVYRYYCCTRKSKVKKCKEKPISEKSLELELIKMIRSVTPSKGLIELGLEILDRGGNIFRFQGSDQITNEKKEILNNRLRNIRMNLSEETDKETRNLMKESVLELKEKLKAIENEAFNQKQEELKNKNEVKDALSLARNMEYKIKNGNNFEKKEIVHFLGVEWILKGRKLSCKRKYQPYSLQTLKNLEEGIFTRSEVTKCLSDANIWQNQWKFILWLHLKTLIRRKFNR